tara:strand:- start:9812 stop:10720 length:909 start_codon:yes stop_codon:yes gene_type:complete
MGMFDRTKNAFNGLLNNKIAEASSRLGDKDPLAKTFFDRMLGSAFPGYGLPSNPNTAIGETEINARIARLIIEAEAMSQAAPTLQSDKTLAKSYDWRARLRPKKGGEDMFYQKTSNGDTGDYLLKPIEESGGMVWQYTPTIMVTGQSNYNQAHMQGMNYQINTFQNSTPPMLPISADFTANDIYEARYLLAIFTFLKICGKGAFGDSAVAAGDYGRPPPVLLFEYMGDHMFNKVPVVMTSYNIQLPEEVDYVPVKVGDTVTHVPTRTNIMVNLEPTYTPQKLRRKFNLDALTSGEAYRDGFI